VQTILDSPVPTPPFQQRHGASQVARDTRDGVVDFDLRLTVAVRGPLDAANLPGGGPIEMTGQTRGGLQTAMFAAAVFLVGRADFI
jgi:hypothetical protein